MKRNGAIWAPALVAALVLALSTASAANVPVVSPINVDTTWVDTNEYILTEPVYVTNGATLTIEPGVVVRGEPESAPNANDPGALVITRGSKINALGTAKHPIIFTDLFDDNIPNNALYPAPTPPYDAAGNVLGLTGQWGGIIILGTGWVANNTLAGPDPGREVQVEGLVAAGGLGLYGNCLSQGFINDFGRVAPFDQIDWMGCDDDSSGNMRYVSDRYGGFNLSAANEINGFTLGAVGRETYLQYLESFQNQDDCIEFFGGAPQIKNLVCANAGDDSIDYDEGFRGKGQFIFVLQNPPGSDKGGEHDGGNNPDGSQPFAIPTFFNVSMIGLGERKNDGTDYAGFSTDTVMNLRDNAGGRYNNSFFGDWGGAAIQIENGAAGGAPGVAQPNTSAERAVTPYTVDGICAGAPFDANGFPALRTTTCEADTDCQPASCPDCDAGDFCKFGFHMPPDSNFQLELRSSCWWCVRRQEEALANTICDDEDTVGVPGPPCSDGGLEEVPGGLDDQTCEWGGSSSKDCFDNGLFTDMQYNPISGMYDTPVGPFFNEYLPCSAPQPIRTLTRFAGGPGVPDPVLEIDPRPAGVCAVSGGSCGSDVDCPLFPGNPADRCLDGALKCGVVPGQPCEPIPDDGFFTPSDYKGAFGNMNWADGWSTMALLGYFPAKGSVLVSSNITLDTTWTADNDYILDKPIYVENGATLTIEAGTTVRGQPESAANANDPGTLIISRGSKIQALGTADKPIVFTNLDDDNIGPTNWGTPPYDNVANSIGIDGTWGGVILLGTGLAANNTLTGPDPAREVQVEGLVAAGGLGLYGNCLGLGNPFPDVSSCDDDDSGVMRYVSSRYGGFNLSAANEINGFTLGGVGRETDIDFIEVYQNRDDGFEFFGGAVEVDHAVVTAVDDDSLDYDEGWRGGAQYWWITQGLSSQGASDKGGEHDGGNNPDGSRPFAIPTMSNFTVIGLGEGGGSSNTGLNIRDNAGGRYRNSFWHDFDGATVQIEAGAAGTGMGTNTSAERSVTPWSLGHCVDPANPTNNASYDPCLTNADCTPPEQCLTFNQGPASEFQLDLTNNTWSCIGRQEDLAAALIADDDGTNGLLDLDSGVCEFGGSSSKDCWDNGMLSDPAKNNQYLACADPLPIRQLERFVDGNPATIDPVSRIDPRLADGSPLISNGTLTEATPSANPPGGPYHGAFGQGNWASCWTNIWRQGMIPECDESTGLPVTAVPDPAMNLRFLDLLKIDWTGPCTNTTKFDLLRSSDPSNFSTALIKPQWNDIPAHKPGAVDADVPALNGVFYYLARAGNGCGYGGIGLASNGVPRTAP